MPYRLISEINFFPRSDCGFVKNAFDDLALVHEDHAVGNLAGKALFMRGSSIFRYAFGCVDQVIEDMQGDAARKAHRLVLS